MLSLRRSWSRGDAGAIFQPSRMKCGRGCSVSPGGAWPTSNVAPRGQADWGPGSPTRSTRPWFPTPPCGSPLPAITDWSGKPWVSCLTPTGELISLIAWEALTPTQAAAALGLTPAATRVRLHRARTRLKNALSTTTHPEEADHDQ